jgi:hypothetical protein
MDVFFDVGLLAAPRALEKIVGRFGYEVFDHTVSEGCLVDCSPSRGIPLTIAPPTIDAPTRRGGLWLAWALRGIRLVDRRSID